MTIAPSLTSTFTVNIRTSTGEHPITETAKWKLEQTERAWSGPGSEVHLRARWLGDTPTRAGLVVRRNLDSAPSRVTLPGLFYGGNGSGSPSTHYPRLGPLDQAAFTAPTWDFASERAPLPAVFAWYEHSVAWLAIEPPGAPTASGVGFSLVEGETELRVHRPGLERPFRHDRVDESPLEPLLEVAPGGSLALTLWYGDIPADGAGSSPVAQVQRALQTAWGGGEGRAVDVARALAAADAAVEGLLRWHFRTEKGASILAEAVSFDGAQVRNEMHVAWVSGAPTAYALLRHGLTRGDRKAADAAGAVLDTVGSGLTPCGAFWGIWTLEGWRAGWNGHPSKLHASTLAEATLFMLRGLELEPEHHNWVAAARSNLDFCVRCMDASGNPGSYYHAQTGEVMDRRGTAGLLWAAALAEAAGVLGEPSYLSAAEQVGAFYAEAIRNGELLGAPEDIGLCPSSEDAYNALISTMALWNATGKKEWLGLARAAADWLLTYRWSYDVRFPAGSPLARRGFRTQGGDIASPSNNHIHPYGLICQRELLELGAALGDPWYAARAADHLACFMGEIALRDGQFGGPERRGMMSEQWYTADWSKEGRSGDIAPTSHAWCLGLYLLAAEEWTDHIAPPARVADHDGKVRNLRGRRSESERIRASQRLHMPTSEAEPDQALKPLQRVAAQRVAVGKPHPVRLLPGFYQVGGGYLSHWRDAASYLLMDEASGEAIMVDCGSHGGIEAVRTNVNLVADLSRVKLVIGTHCHWDHVEAFGHLREETDALFAIHALDAQAVRTGDPDLTCAGFLYNETFHRFPVDVSLRGGERFRIGEYDLEVLHLPGHAPGCIGVLAHYARTGQTILIPGDAVQGGFGKKIKSSVSFWKRSMRRLMSEKIDFMVPNHMPPGAQTSLLADVSHRLARIYSLLETDFHDFMEHQRT